MKKKTLNITIWKIKKLLILPFGESIFYNFLKLLICANNL